PAAEVAPARRQVELADAPAAGPPVDHQGADEPPAQAAETRPRGREGDAVGERLPLVRPGAGEGVGQPHERGSLVGGVYLVGDAVLPAAVVDPAPAPPEVNAGLEDALAHPAVGVEGLALLHGRLLLRPPPVVMVAAPRSAHRAVPPPRLFRNHQ